MKKKKIIIIIGVIILLIALIYFFHPIFANKIVAELYPSLGCGYASSSRPGDIIKQCKCLGLRIGTHYTGSGKYICIGKCYNCREFIPW